MNKAGPGIFKGQLVTRKCESSLGDDEYVSSNVKEREKWMSGRHDFHELIVEMLYLFVKMSQDKVVVEGTSSCRCAPMSAQRYGYQNHFEFF